MELIPEVAKSVAGALVTLGGGWLIGQKLTYAWTIRQKRREFLLTATNQFHTAYGEFFIVWKLWSRLDPSGEDRSKKQWELLQRVANAEATVESILLKIVTEICLAPEEVEQLGRFRQAFQSLRQAVRSNEELDWVSKHPAHYLAFKQLSCRVAVLLQQDRKPLLPGADEAANNYVTVTSNRWKENWWETTSMESPESLTFWPKHWRRLLGRSTPRHSAVHVLHEGVVNGLTSPTSPEKC